MSKTTQEKKKKLSEAKSAQGGAETQKIVEEQTTSISEIDTTAREAQDNTPVSPDAEVSPETEAETKVRQSKVRGKKYLDAKKKVDATKYYPLSEAVKLAQATSISKFEGKIEAHLITLDQGTLGDIAFPHLSLGEKKIVVLNDTVLAEIKDGKINFDILIATPATMPKLLPFARLLGPKGLMPNPKNGTLTDKPEEAQKRLAVAKTVVKTEKKAPVVHLVVGKVSQPTEEIVANIAELIKTIRANKIKKLVLSATMGPGIKVVLEK
jgi:large subunit ribosomal protein L1